MAAAAPDRASNRGGSEVGTNQVRGWPLVRFARRVRKGSRADSESQDAAERGCESLTWARSGIAGVLAVFRPGIAIVRCASFQGIADAE